MTFRVYGVLLAVSLVIQVKKSEHRLGSLCHHVRKLLSGTGIPACDCASVEGRWDFFTASGAGGSVTAAE